jgi:hypothetical protein
MQPLKKLSPPFIALTVLITISLACSRTAGAPSPDEIETETVASETSEPLPSAVEPTVTPEPTNTPHPADTDAPPASTPESIEESAAGSGIESSIMGTWKSVCMDLGDGAYIIITIVFDGAGQLNDRADFYSDPGCASATGVVKTSQTSYSLGDSIIINDKNASEIDLTITSWELKQDGDVVTSGTNEPTQYDVIAVEGDTLYNSGLTRADPGPILSPGDRPTTLDLANFYTRQ